MSRIFGAWSNIDLTIPIGHISLIKTSFEALLFYLNFYYKRYVYVRPCTKYPTHDIKPFVAKQGDTGLLVHYKVLCLIDIGFDFLFSLIGLCQQQAIPSSLRYAGTFRVFAKVHAIKI
ncbi:hypothetical protein BpHYR1_007901 [Brachionus plicatilis]|uniref:Uncharacterized protein n=1 Tax=Brachionus plicatilis TaxID=10195 RepID=A0A3M7QHV9_BRAPC|nr:hypothetical protein BpHYR1_007901 [Brachionus plicatilis]